MQRQTPPTSPEESRDTPIEFVSPGKFSIHNPSVVNRPERIRPAPPLFLHGREEVHQHSLQLIRQARHTVHIYSPDFEPWLYDSDRMVAACKDFLLRHANNRLQILLHDSQRLLSESHRLLALIERLSNRAQIRLTHPQQETIPDCWLSIDGHGLLLRKTSAPHQGQLLCGQPAKARSYFEQFAAMWDLSRIDINLRRMPL